MPSTIYPICTLVLLSWFDWLFDFAVFSSFMGHHDTFILWFETVFRIASTGMGLKIFVVGPSRVLQEGWGVGDVCTTIHTQKDPKGPKIEKKSRS